MYLKSSIKQGLRLFFLSIMLQSIIICSTMVQTHTLQRLLADELGAVMALGDEVSALTDDAADPDGLGEEFSKADLFPEDIDLGEAVSKEDTISPGEPAEGDAMSVGSTAQKEPEAKPALLVETASPESFAPAGEVFTITAYCTCVKCCGVWSVDHPSRQGTDYQQLTASGSVPEAGRTAGADWSVLPAGTAVDIEGLGRYVIEDSGPDWVFDRYGGKLIDLYFSSHDEAAAFGRQQLEVWVVGER